MRRIVLFDPHPVVRAGTRALLESAAPPRFEIVGEASHADDLHDILENLRPDVLLTETDIPFRSGLSVTWNAFDALQSVAKLEGMQIIFFARNPTDHNIARAYALGAVAFLSKADPWKTTYDELIGAVQLGKPLEHSRLAAGANKRMSKIVDDSVPLTNREIQVLRHVATGLSNREIGTSLGISVETVKEHVQNMLRKLNVSDRTQAAVWAVKKGLA